MKKYTQASQATDEEPFRAEMEELTPLQESDDLLDWWKKVECWDKWNDSSNFMVEDEEQAVEQVADRVFMGARLFVRLFNQRGASLQQSILKLLAQADSADHFHKKTVSAAVGGGVASVVGSVTTITGLILAPFTFGASVIVTAVGISVATAGSIASASANITDTVHSKMDRKKVEKIIQSYQEEMNDIHECLMFVQEGIDTLQEWNFEKYSESTSKKALNHNIKHVFKEGGRAGKVLMINTDKLISTVQVLGAAGGAAKAAQAVSVTTGVMSALFLALDVFFLAKDSHELRKGAKTKFASKLREVCMELQDGLLELNNVKTQLQKTMGGIELEEFEEEVVEEVEVDKMEADPGQLAQLKQELDLLEDHLNKTKHEEQNINDGSMEKVEKNKNESCKDKIHDDKHTDKDQEKERIKSDKYNGGCEKTGMAQHERKGEHKDKRIKENELIKKEHRKKDSNNDTKHLENLSEDKKHKRGNTMTNQETDSSAVKRKQTACNWKILKSKVTDDTEKVEEKSKEINGSSKTDQVMNSREALGADSERRRESEKIHSVGKRSGDRNKPGREMDRGSKHDIWSESEKPPGQNESERKSKHEIRQSGRTKGKNLTDDTRCPFMTEKSETRTGETERGLRDWEAKTGRSQKGQDIGESIGTTDGKSQKEERDAQNGNGEVRCTVPNERRVKREGGRRMQSEQKRPEVRRPFESRELTGMKREIGDQWDFERGGTGSTELRKEEPDMPRKESRPRSKAFLGDGLYI